MGSEEVQPTLSLPVHSFRVGGAVPENTGHGPVPEPLCSWADGVSRPGLWRPQLETPSDNRHRPCLPALLLFLVRRRPWPVTGHPSWEHCGWGMQGAEEGVVELGWRVSMHCSSGRLHGAQEPSIVAMCG